jgi:hypothetical protein
MARRNAEPLSTPLEFPSHLKLYTMALKMALGAKRHLPNRQWAGSHEPHPLL